MTTSAGVKNYSGGAGTLSGVPNLSNVPNIGEISAQDLSDLTQQLSSSWIVGKLFPNEIPGLDKVKKGFDSIAQFLVQLLEIVNQILQVAKVFVAAYANPVQTLAKVLIDQIKVLINDIAQIGVYITSDADLFKDIGWPFAPLRGGYYAYEQRMVARLTDTSDPTRPNVSNQTYVLGVFAYASVDITGVYQMLKGIQQLLALFSFSLPVNALPSCSPPKVRYGFDPYNLVASFTVAFRNASNPVTIANLEWTIDRPRAGSPVLTVPLPPPQGFIIEVSTVLGGLALFVDRPSSTKGGSVSDKSGNSAEPREIVIATDSDDDPVIVYGGFDVIDCKSENSISTAYDTAGNLKPGANYYFLARVSDKASNELIPPDKLLNTEDGTYYLQRSFKLSQAELVLDPTIGVYRYALDAKDMPHEASFVRNGDKFDVIDLGQPSNYYVRISAISDEADQYPIGNPQSALQYDLTKPPAPQGDVIVTLINQAKPSVQRGKPSLPAPLVFPSKQTNDLLSSLRSALALIVLLRADLSVLDSNGWVFDPTVERYRSTKTLPDLLAHKLPAGPYAQSVLPFTDGLGTNLESFANTLFSQMVPNKVPYYNGTTQTPEAWGQALYGVISNLADQLYKQTGSLPAVEKLVSEKTKELRELTFTEISGGKTDFDATIQSALLGKYKDGTDINLNGFGANGLASSTHQATKATGLALSPSTLKSNDFPYLWQETPRYTLLERQSYEKTNAEIISAGMVIKESGTYYFNYTSPEAYMAFLGYRKGTQKEFGVGTSTTVEYLQLDEKPPQKIHFQSEGFPILYSRNTFGSGLAVQYTPIRSLFDTTLGRQVLDQAQLVLGYVAAQVQQGPIKGQWYALRFGNTFAAGALERALQAFNQYVKAVNNAFASAVRVITDYIDFLQARIRELQRFINLINYYIQQINLIVIPQLGLLITIAPGTQGTLSAFLSAKNKPIDGAVTYGAGAAVVVPLLAGTKFILDLIIAAQKANAGG